jgi:hypothetical protein
MLALRSLLKPDRPLDSRDAHLLLRGLRGPARGHSSAFQETGFKKHQDISELKAADKGGMIFQPELGVYEKVHQIDFTSLYPSIIVK